MAGVGFIITEEVVALQFVVASVYENVTVPAEIALTKPALVTVAIPLLLLVHVPPVLGDKVAVAPTHIEAGAVTIGNAFTVTVAVVLLQLVEPSVKVNVTVPGVTPVMTPALVTVAIALLLLIHVPPVVGDKVAVAPTQMDAGAVTTGSAYTVTDVVVLLQLVLASVKVKVTLPEAIPVMTPALVTVAIALLLLVHVPPVIGDRVAFAPTQIGAGAVKTGRAFTVTAVVVLLQLVVPSVKVKVTLPAATPVMTPELVTVAIALLLLVQVPLVIGDRVAFAPTQIEAGAVKTGRAFTVTAVVVLLQLVVPSVKVKVTLPAATPVMTPALVTVAIALLLLVQVPPVVGVKMAVAPTHIDAGAVTTGCAYTVTAVVVLLQLVVPSVKVKVTLPGAKPVMTPALVTVAIPLSLLVQVPPAVGDKVAVLPTQVDAGAKTVGSGFTVMV
jgi:hypothetical protein